MNATQTLDRTAVIALALAAASIVATVAMSTPALTKQAAAPQATPTAVAEAAPAEGAYKVVVTAQRLPQRVAASHTVHAGRSL